MEECKKTELQPSGIEITPDNVCNKFDTPLGSGHTLGNLVFLYLETKTLASFMICCKWLLERATLYVEKTWKEQFHIKSELRILEKHRALRVYRLMDERKEKDETYAVTSKITDISMAVRLARSFSKNFDLKCSEDGLVISSADNTQYIVISVTCTGLWEFACTTKCYSFIKTDLGGEYTSLLLRESNDTLDMYLTDRGGNTNVVSGRLSKCRATTDSSNEIRFPSSFMSIRWSLIKGALCHEEFDVIFFKVRSGQLDILGISSDGSEIDIKKGIPAGTNSVDGDTLLMWMPILYIFNAVIPLLDEDDPTILFSQNGRHMNISYSVRSISVQANAIIMEHNNV